MSDIAENYLIVGLKGLVLVDIIGAIEDAFPKCGAITAKCPAEAAKLAAKLKSLKFAIVNLDPDEFVRTELASRLAALGTRIVMMGHAAEENAKTLPFDVLDRPFEDTDIIRLLEKENTACNRAAR